MKGEPGAKGARGPQGNKGSTGDAGRPGAPGAVGLGGRRVSDYWLHMKQDDFNMSLRIYSSINQQVS